MLVVQVGEGITVGRGLRRSCGGDQATQNILRDGALATMLGEGIAKGLCHGAGHRRAFDRGEFSCQAVGFRVFDVEHKDRSRQENKMSTLYPQVGERGSCSLSFSGE